MRRMYRFAYKGTWALQASGQGISLNASLCDQAVPRLANSFNTPRTRRRQKILRLLAKAGLCKLGRGTAEATLPGGVSLHGGTRTFASKTPYKMHHRASVMGKRPRHTQRRFKSTRGRHGQRGQFINTLPRDAKGRVMRAIVGASGGISSTRPRLPPRAARLSGGQGFKIDPRLGPVGLSAMAAWLKIPSSSRSGGVKPPEILIDLTL